MRQRNSFRQADAELLERRVLMNAPPHKFVLPVGGRPGVDWAITAYTDQNPLPDEASDYRGRQYTFEGSESVHFALDGYGSMDRGVDVYAAAPGTVVEAHDGEFDRHHVAVDPPPPDNYVLIDHGGGWRTRYGSLRNGSVSVSPGQAVTAGQTIGLVGGSAVRPSNYFIFGPHLDFKVTQDGAAVETFLEPESFWQSPPPFAGDAPAVHYMATAEAQPQNTAAGGFETNEHISHRTVFHPGDRVWVLTVWHGINREVERQYRYFRPDGVQLTDTANTATTDRGQVWRNGFVDLIGANVVVGTWEVAAELDGVEVGRTSFRVTDPSEGVPEIKMYQGTTYVIDGRTTPLDFGTVGAGAGPAILPFSVRNHGSEPLLIDRVTLPPGFTLAGAVPASVPAGTSRIFSVQLDDRIAGAKSGRVTIHCNDADEAEFDFAVKGAVSGVPAAVEKVFVGSSGWSDGFGGRLQEQELGSSVHGFEVPTSDATQPGSQLPAPLPWATLDRLSIRFSGDVHVSQADLTVEGVSLADLEIREFAYDPQERTATWTLWRSLGNDRYTIWLAPAVTGATRTFRVDVLPGDADRSGRVNALDLSLVKARANRTAAEAPPAGLATYSPFADIDGNGRINALDLAAVKAKSNLSLPAQPIALAASASPFADSPVVVSRSQGGVTRRRAWDDLDANK